MTRGKQDHQGLAKGTGPAQPDHKDQPPGGFGEEARQHEREIEQAKKDAVRDSTSLPLTPRPPD